MPRVFISHSSLDHELVEREIISPLRAHGVETWYSTDNIKSAAEWERQIREGLKESDWFLIALSPRSVSSEWVGREVHWAFLKRKERIIPVMLETCEPDELHLGLLPLQFIDFRNDVVKAQDKLLAVWGLNKSAQAETHYRAAQDALAREDWNTAAEYLEEALRLDPAHTQASADLERARQRQELDALYEAGINDLRNGRWRDALTTLRRVQEIGGDYKDVAALIARAKSELQKEEAAQLYREACEAAEREEWAEAAGQFEAVLKLDPSHAEAQAALARARQQAELAELYAAGREYLRAERYGDALKNFRRVRVIDKSYGRVADLIADADAAEERLRSQREEAERKAQEEAERRDREAKEEAERQERERQAKELSEPQERRAKQQLYNEALDAFSRKDWVTARKKLRAAKTADPDDKEIMAKLAKFDSHPLSATLFDDGLQHMDNERWAEALDVFYRVKEVEGNYKDVSAQITRAEAELKSLGEKKRQRRQDIEDAERKELEKARSARHGNVARGDAEPATDADDLSRQVFIVAAVLLGALLMITAFVLWGEG